MLTTVDHILDHAIPGGGHLLPAPVISGPALLADFDYTVPVTQSLPTTAAALATQLGNAGATPSYIWLCDENSGNLVDEIASEALVPANGPLQNRNAFPLWNGSSYSKTAVEFLNSTIAKFENASAAIMDATTTKVGYLVMFRAHATPSSPAMFLNKGRFLTAGVELGMTTVGAVFLQVTGVTGDVSIWDATEDFADGAIHVAIITIDPTGNHNIRLDQGLDKSSATIVGSITSADKLSLGGGRLNTAPVQLLYVAAFEGAAVTALETLGANAVSNFMSIGADPGVAAGKTALTTTSRNSLISHEVAPGKVGHFSGGTTLDTCQLPITHSPALDGGAGGLGLYCNSDVVNQVENNRGIAGATGATTNTANFADASDGFRAATKSTATVANDFIGKTNVVVAETEYTGSIYIKEETVGVVGRVYAYDLTNGAEIAGSSVAYTADGTWEQRIKTTFTTPAGCISVSLRAEITNNGESILHDFWQLELGDGAGAIINTNGAAAALVYCNYAAVASAGVLTKAATGEIEYVYSIPAPSNNQWAVTCSGVGNNNLRAMLFNPNPQARVFNSSGGVEADINSGSQDTEAESTSVLSWDDSGGLGGGKDAILTFNGGSSVDDVGSFTSTETLTKVQIGNWSTPASTFAVDGLISRVRIWDRERP